MPAILKKPFFYIFTRTLIVLCTMLGFITLLLFLFRNSVVLWASDFWLPENTAIECLDFDIGKSPFIVINSICFRSNDLEIEITDAEYEVGSGSIDKSYFLAQASVNIERIFIHHFESNDSNIGTEKPKNSSVDLWSLPDLLPLIQVKHLKIDSYLMQQPVNLTLSQLNRSELVVAGDIEAKFAVGKGKVSGDLIWSGQLLTTNSQLLDTTTEPYQNFVEDWQGLMNMPIHTSFQYTGSTLQSSHTINLENKITYNDCGIPVNMRGDLVTELTLSSWEFEINTQGLDINIDVDKCIDKTLNIEDLQLGMLALSFPSSISISNSGINIPLLSLTSTSKGNPLLFELSQVNINQQNDVRLDYQLNLSSTFNEFYDNPKIRYEHLSLQSHGTLYKNQHEFEISGERNIISTTNLSIEQNHIKDINGNISLNLVKQSNQDWKPSGKGSVTVKNFSAGEIHINALQNQFTLSGETLDQTEIEFSNSIQSIKYQDANVVKNINSQVTLKFDQNQYFSAVGKSKLASISSAAIKLGSIDIIHHINGDLTANNYTGNHEFTLPAGLLGNLFHENQNFNVLVPEQPVTYLNPLLKQVLPDANLVMGKLEFALNNENPSKNLIANIKFDSVSLEYQDYQIVNAHMDESFSIDSSGIQLNNGKITIEEINVGIPLTEVNASLSILNNVPKLDFARAQIIGGEVALTDFWLDNRKQILKLDIEDVDLKKLVELQNQDGIEVTGEISGNLPISWSSGFNNIDKGTLINDGPGKLKISNNEAFNAIKKQQKELAFLENVEFSKLSSEVSLTDDGWLDLKIGINGVNPEKNQEINFNYTHKENIFTLFKSMRITNSVQNSIEKRLKQRLSNKDNNL